MSFKAKEEKILTVEPSRTQLATLGSTNVQQKLLYKRQNKLTKDFRKNLRKYDDEIDNLKKTLKDLNLEGERTRSESSADEKSQFCQKGLDTDDVKSPKIPPKRSSIFFNDSFVTPAVHQARDKIKTIRKQESEDRLLLSRQNNHSSQLSTQRANLKLTRSASLSVEVEGSLRKTWPPPVPLSANHTAETFPVLSRHFFPQTSRLTANLESLPETVKGQKKLRSMSLY